MKKNTVKKTKKVTAKSKGCYESESKKIKNGAVLECQECGMVLVVDELCGCEEYHPVVCCGSEMIIK
ncbi:MAG: hypothetical protein N3B13_03510 [Deltaproteobacteria bacterium]|nr:hypothetical protein [Deltaproteobacteria bacterium]